MVYKVSLWAFFLITGGGLVLHGQGQVRLEITGAEIYSTCFDVSKEKDMVYGVSIDGSEVVYYAENSICFDSLPRKPWVLDYECPKDIPDSLDICFEIFENDGLIYTCQVLKACPAQICTKIPLPKTLGSSPELISISQENDSWGKLYFTVSNTSTIDLENDNICAPFDLGTLAFEDALGTLNLSQYQNICATGQNEPNPENEGGFENTAGVWFVFHTDDNPSSIVLIDGRSDPGNVGDPIDLEIAIYESMDGSCSISSMTLLKTQEDALSNDIQVSLPCVKPQTDYYILVDGNHSRDGMERGFFDLRISGGGIKNGADAVCDAEQLGSLDAGLASSVLVSNFCSSDENNGIWFEFTAPSSGNVNIEALIPTNFNPIDLELAVFELGEGDCAGKLNLLEQSTNDNLAIGCLYPGETYYVFVKGVDGNQQGVFNLNVEDAGLVIPPSTLLADTLCFGESYPFGDSIYQKSGSYFQRIPQVGSCDSLVYLDLVILDSLEVSVDIIRPASNEGFASGQAEVKVIGGSGDFSVSWCNGTIGIKNTTIIGGDTCCVEVVDRFGCRQEFCFFMPFLNEIVLDSFSTQSPLCSDSRDGSVTFTPKGGEGPYQIAVVGPLPCENCGIVKNRVDSTVIFEGLAKGSYEIRLQGQFQDTIYTFEMDGPQPLEITQTSYKAVSCTDDCDGMISINISGGTSPYQLDWGSGLTDQMTASNLCAGTIDLEVVDILGCRMHQEFVLDNPSPLKVNLSVEQAVSCDGAQDGKIRASGSQENIRFDWNTGQNGATIAQLGLGSYEVTVTNALGCRDSAQVQLVNFVNPLQVNIESLEPVSCNGKEDGVLLAKPQGRNYTYSYLWNTQAREPKLADLAAGSYAVTVTNNLGCKDSARFVLEEPTAIEVSFAVKNIDCIGGPASGRLNINTVSGGSGNYQYAIDGNKFASDPELNYIPEGQYILKVKDSRGCLGEFPFELEGPPDVKVDIPDTLSVKLGEQLNVTPVTNIADVEFMWSENHQVVSTSSTLDLEPPLTTAYTLQVFDPVSGCSAFDTLEVRVDQTRRVYIPNVFSPNEDGYNERFGIYGDLDVEKINQLEIFDRYGNLVFRRGEHLANQIDDGWDGTRQNQVPAQEGVYIYVAQITFIDGKVEVFKGDVLLMR